MSQKNIQEIIVEILPRLRRYAIALTKSQVDADDLVQETCWRALSKADQWDPSQELGRWVFGIAHNAWVSEIRKRKVRTGTGAVPSEDSCGAFSESLIAKENADDVASLNDVLRVVLSLPEAQSVTLLLVAAEGFTYREVADHLNIPVGTVMSRISKARQEVKRLLQESNTSECLTS